MSISSVYLIFFLSLASIFFKGQTDWLTNGLSLAQDSKGNTLLEEFNSNYEVVFVDLTGLVNLTSSVTKVNYIRVRIITYNGIIISVSFIFLHMYTQSVQWKM